MKIAVISATLLLSVTAAQAADTALDAATQALAAGRWNKSAFWSQKALAAPGLSSADTVKALTALCIAQAKLGRLSQADETCDQAVVLGPAEWTGYINRGNLRVLTGDVAGAQADYARAKALKPGHPVAQAAAEMLLTVGTPLTASFVGLGRDRTAVVQTATSGRTAGEQ